VHIMVCASINAQADIGDRDLSLTDACRAWLDGDSRGRQMGIAIGPEVVVEGGLEILLRGIAVVNRSQLVAARQVVGVTAAHEHAPALVFGAERTPVWPRSVAGDLEQTLPRILQLQNKWPSGDVEKWHALGMSAWGASGGAVAG
jgi:hypothetical protein